MQHDETATFLFDVDNTLLDNDAATQSFLGEIRSQCGDAAADRYFEIYQDQAKQLGYSDYLGALQRYRQERAFDPKLLQVGSFLLDYPFEQRLYPRALEVVLRANQLGRAVLLTDGDVVFQPRKVKRSGLWQAVEGRVLIYVHKELELADVEQRYPSRHYVMVDDKLRLLTAIKKIWGPRVTTVFPRQGHYAVDPQILAAYPPADIAIDHIADLLTYDLASIIAAARP